MRTPDGRLAILDFGLMTQVPSPTPRPTDPVPRALRVVAGALAYTIAYGPCQS